MPRIRYSFRPRDPHFRQRDRQFRQTPEIGHHYFGTPGHALGISGHTFSESAVTLHRNTQLSVSEDSGDIATALRHGAFQLARKTFSKIAAIDGMHNAGLDSPLPEPMNRLVDARHAALIKRTRAKSATTPIILRIGQTDYRCSGDILKAQSVVTEMAEREETVSGLVLDLLTSKGKIVMLEQTRGKIEIEYGEDRDKMRSVRDYCGEDFLVAIIVKIAQEAGRDPVFSFVGFVEAIPTTLFARKGNGSGN